ncbi:hypothetical protein EI613_03725 [Azospirillum sp. 412522]|nr:hypothetical protein [Azospirillum sp. 412522]MBY6261036.1 hypothetical protein [Azospirillum sp. 412522]
MSRRPNRRLVIPVLCLILAAAAPATVRTASAFEVQSGGIPLSAATVSMLANRVGNAPPTAAGGGGAFPPWMGGGRTGATATGAGLSSVGLPGAGLPPQGRTKGAGAADRAAMNEQLFGIKR